MRSLFDGLWKQNSDRWWLYPRLLREVGDLAFTIAIASSIPNTPYFFYDFEQSGI
jgi:hypothetical protein